MRGIHKKNILITGGTGFIGNALTKRLVGMGIYPHLLVRNEESISDPILPKDKIHIVNIADANKLNTVIREIQPKIVFHLAAFGVYTYSDNSFKNTKSIIDTNIQGTANLFYALEDIGCELMINTGSCFEYGDSGEPFAEDAKLNPCNLYGVSKLCSTKMVHKLADIFGLSVITLRPFTAYGPGQKESRFIFTAVKNALSGVDIKIPEKDIVRDYIYIDDVVKAYLAAAEKENLNSAIINVSTGKGRTLEDVVNIIKEITNSDSKIKRGGFSIREGEVLSLVGCNLAAKNILDWFPENSLEQGLEKVVSFMRSKIPLSEE